MKKVFLRLAFTVVLLLAFGVVFGGFNSSAHAAAYSELQTTSSHIVTQPKIYVANCTNNTVDFFTSDGTEYCFADAGSTPAVIPNVTIICGGAYTGEAFTTIGNLAIRSNFCERISPATLETVIIF